MFVFLWVFVDVCLLVSVSRCLSSWECLWSFVLWMIVDVRRFLIKDIKKYVFNLQFWNKGVSIHVAQGRVRRVCVKEMSATAGKTNSVGRLRRLRRVVSHWVWRSQVTYIQDIATFLSFGDTDALFWSAPVSLYLGRSVIGCHIPWSCQLVIRKSATL